MQVAIYISYSVHKDDVERYTSYDTTPTRVVATVERVASEHMICIYMHRRHGVLSSSSSAPNGVQRLTSEMTEVLKIYYIVCIMLAS